MTAPRPRSRQPKQLDAGIFQAEINSLALRLAAEGKAAETIRTYTEAVQWFAASLSGQGDRGSWEQVSSREIQQWMARLLGRYTTTQHQSLLPNLSSSRLCRPRRWPHADHPVLAVAVLPGDRSHSPPVSAASMSGKMASARASSSSPVSSWTGWGM
jgi:hypothetical protein